MTYSSVSKIKTTFKTVNFKNNDLLKIIYDIIYTIILIEIITTKH